VHQTARRQDGRSVHLPPTPLAPDPPSRRRRGHHPGSYCSSHISAWLLQTLLAGLQLCTIEPFQRVHNAAARLIFELSPSEHAHHTKPTPVTLDTLARPVKTMLLYACSCYTGRCPAYLGSIVQPATQSRSGLRPSSFDFSVPRTRTKFGERAFSYAGPSAWNTLPRHIRETVDSAIFRKLLKTHYFTSAFGVLWFLQLFYLRFTFTLTFVLHLWSRL